MATPTKEQIIEEATKLYMARNWGLSSNTPEINELKEEGVYAEAQHDLMRSEGHATMDYLEELASENGFELIKSKVQYVEDLEDFPLENILREGCFATGGRGTGKSNLLKLLVQRLLSAKVEVKVKIFDPSLTWKTFPLPRIKVTEDLSKNSRWNCVYDISRLGVLEARNYVSEMVKRDLEEAIILTDNGVKHKALILFEEAQNIFPSDSLRSKKFLDVSRFATQGRNFGLSYAASTQRLASVDINLVEISGIKYFFKLEGHRNIAKARYWLPKFTVFRLRDLEIGTCYLQCGSKLKLLRLPLFEAKKVIA